MGIALVFVMHAVAGTPDLTGDWRPLGRKLDSEGMGLRVSADGTFTWSGEITPSGRPCQIRGTLETVESGVRFGSQADHDAHRQRWKADPASPPHCRASGSVRYGEIARVVRSSPDSLALWIPEDADTGGVEPQLRRACRTLAQFVRAGSEDETRVRSEIAEPPNRRTDRWPTIASEWLVVRHVGVGRINRCSAGTHQARMTTTAEGGFTAEWSDGCTESGQWSFHVPAEGVQERRGFVFEPRGDGCGRLAGKRPLWSELGHNRALVLKGAERRESFELMVLGDPVGL